MPDHGSPRRFDHDRWRRLQLKDGRATLARAALLTCLSIAGPARAQPGEAVALFAGTLDGWHVENTSAGNFSVHDGVLRVEGPEGWLRSQRRYADFRLRAEFRFVTDDADSGIFVRTPGESVFARGWPSDSYQIQLRNPAGESPFPPVGGLFRHGTPAGETQFDEADAERLSARTGEWQVIEIELDGSELAVELNGEPLMQAAGLVNERGYIGIQGETGVVEFRSIELVER